MSDNFTNCNSTATISNKTDVEQLELKHIIDLTETFLLFVKRLQNVTEIIDKHSGANEKCTSNNSLSSKNSDTKKKEITKRRSETQCSDKDRKCKNFSAPNGVATTIFEQPHSCKVLSHGSICFCESCTAANNFCKSGFDNEIGDNKSPVKSNKNKKRTGRHVSTMIKALTSQFQSKKP